MKKKWTVYIVLCQDKTFYTGISNDYMKRLEKHNSGKGAKYINLKRRPVKLVYLEAKRSIGDALRRELKIKKMSKINKIKLTLKYKMKKVK
ncbi:MAG: GIY-YIG nuclease family protein [bacterium]